MIKLIPELIHRFFRTFFAPFRNFLLGLFNGAAIHPLAFVDSNVKIGKKSIIAKSLLSTYGGKGCIEIGSNSIIYENVELFAHKNAKISIGDHCFIARKSAILTADHIFADKNKLISEQGTVEADVIIEDDVWIGYDAKILKGITVGKGSVVGAGSIVTKDVPPFSVVAGIPARIMKTRN